jgi:hypothetical protein
VISGFQFFIHVGQAIGSKFAGICFVHDSFRPISLSPLPETLFKERVIQQLVSE